MVLSENIDLFCLNLLKKISFLFPNLNISVQNKTFSVDNICVFGLSNFVKDINSSESICFVLMVDPKTECSLLNTRLRVQCRNSILSVFSFGQFMLTNVPINFVFLNIENFIRVFEGKSAKLSKLFLTSSLPLLVVGDSIYSKFSNIFGLLNNLIQVNNSFKFLKIGSSCNTEGIKFLNVKSLSSNHVRKSEYILGFDLDDIFSLRKYLTFSEKSIL